MSKPWIEGPKELILHGIEHSNKDTAFDARIAFISIDNAVELMIKTYLGLPKRITNIKGLKRNDLEDASQNFPALLDLLESFGADKIRGIELGDIEWYHRLRNQLYHEGNGITIGIENISGYLEIAKILFNNLFEEKLVTSKLESPEGLTGIFIKLWGELEQFLYIHTKSKKIKNTIEYINLYYEDGRLTKDDVQNFDLLRNFRNELVHGIKSPTPDKLAEMIDNLESLKEKLGVN